jgi:hypothetical protein
MDTWEESTFQAEGTGAKAQGLPHGKNCRSLECWGEWQGRDAEDVLALCRDHAPGLPAASATQKQDL